MFTKNFEHVVQFYMHQGQSQTPIYIPLVEVNLLTPQNSRIQLSLLFDTGADTTTLRKECYPLLGLTSWDEGEPVGTATASGLATVYKYNATLEVFGKTISCPIHLADMPANPFFLGLLGRDTIFREFGFGFWERSNQLFISSNPDQLSS